MAEEDDPKLKGDRLAIVAMMIALLPCYWEEGAEEG